MISKFAIVASLLTIWFEQVNALPERYPFQDDGRLDARLIADVEQKHGVLPWFSEHSDLELKGSGLDKRAVWAGPCGNGANGSYYISNADRVFQMKCSMPDLATCIDRCANETYWNYNPTAKCRAVELRNNGECRMYAPSTTWSMTYNPTATATAMATFITTAGCYFPNICTDSVYATETRGFLSSASCMNSCAATSCWNGCPPPSRSTSGAMLSSAPMWMSSSYWTATTSASSSLSSLISVSALPPVTSKASSTVFTSSAAQASSSSMFMFSSLAEWPPWRTVTITETVTVFQSYLAPVPSSGSAPSPSSDGLSVHSSGSSAARSPVVSATLSSSELFTSSGGDIPISSFGPATASAASTISTASIAIFSAYSSVPSAATTSGLLPSQTPVADYQYPQPLMCPDIHDKVYNNSYGELYFLECGITHVGGGGGMGPMSFSECVETPDRYYWANGVGAIWDSASTNCMLMTSMEDQPYYIPDVWNARKLALVSLPALSSSAVASSSGSLPESTSSILQLVSVIESSAPVTPVMSSIYATSSGEAWTCTSTTPTRRISSAVSIIPPSAWSTTLPSSSAVPSSVGDVVLPNRPTLPSEPWFTASPSFSSSWSESDPRPTSWSSATLPLQVTVSSTTTISRSSVAPSSSLSQPKALIRNGNFEASSDGTAAPWIFVQEDGVSSVYFSNNTAVITPSPGSSLSKAYLYQAVSGIEPGVQYTLGINVFVTLPPQAECTLDYGAGSQTFRTTSLDSYSPTRYRDVLSGAFNSNAAFFFVRLTCTSNGNAGSAIGLGNVSLSLL